MMTVSLRSMRYFNAALAHGSISRAAAELNVAASAVSAAIDKIEMHFQLTLVNRFRSRGITATASGKAMERKFKRLLEDYDSVMLQGSELKQALQGELRIGYYAPVAPAFLPEILKFVASAEDKITLHLEECDNDRAQDGLLAGEFDAILFLSDYARPQIRFDVLIEAPAYCLVAATHPLAQQKTVALHRLAEEKLIVLNRPFAVDYYRRLIDGAGQETTPCVYANSTEMVRSLVGAEYGCAILNMLPATDTSYGGHRLVALPITDPLNTLSLALGYDKSNPRRLVSYFVQRCLSYFGDGAGQRHIVNR
ncbi:MAG: LysR family transcriptional regulator [Pseudomonadota bacterium]